MPTPPPFSPSVALLAVARRWDRELSEALRPLHLTIRKYGLLGHIASTPGVSFSELARRAGISVPSVHSMVGALAASGFVVDDAAQAGVPSRLEVTTAGRAVLDQASGARTSVDEHLMTEHPELCDVLADMTRRMMGGG